MADKPDNATLREVRNELVGLTMDQARALGVPVPDLRAAEALVDPVMRKVEVDADDEARKALAPAPTPDRNKNVKSGEWYGEAGHSPQIGGDNSRIKGDAEVRGKELGEYGIGKDGRLKPLNGAPLPPQPTVLELAIEKMMNIPVWKTQLLAAAKLCDRHLSPVKHCTLCERREIRIGEIVQAAHKKLTQRERRIQVGGK